MRNPLHSLVKRLFRLRRTPVVARRLGCLFLLDPRNWIDNRLLAGARYETAQLAAAKAAILQRQCTLIVDIGANFGLYSVVLGKLPGVKSIIAFEPVARNYAQLQANLFLNGLTAKAQARQFAVGSRERTETIHIDPRSTGVSRLDLASARRDVTVFSESETVTVVRFDDVISVANQSAFVKIDVEGHAVDALNGMRQFLSANAVLLQIELAESERAPARAILQDLGYRALGEIEGDFIFESGPTLGGDATLSASVQ